MRFLLKNSEIVNNAFKYLRASLHFLKNNLCKINRVHIKSVKDILYLSAFPFNLRILVSNYSFLITLSFGLFFIGCQNDSTQGKTTEALDKLATTPEGIVRQYQAYIDKNEFDKAKRVSTPSEQDRLELLKAIITGDLLEGATMTTTFTALDCQETGNKALCVGTYVEDEEAFQDTFFLEKMNNQWLVTITEEVEEPIIIESEEIVQ